MDYYPQPRPVLYGTSGEEAPPQTQTAPVRTGPPRYPPAPPLAGDAPDPFYRPPRTLTDVHERSATALALLYAIASAYSLMQIMLGTTQFAGSVMGRIVLSGEIVIGLILIMTLVRLGGLKRIDRRGAYGSTLIPRDVSSWEYRFALGLVALHVSVGIVFAQWQSPALWVAIAVMLYLLRPSMMKRYGRRAFVDFRSDLARFRLREPAGPTHSWLPYFSEQGTLRRGQAVRITEGPFADFEGIVDSIDPEKGKVRVRVSMFGRETPVELDFPQVERLV